ncbi:MAG: TonB family protein [Ramlibacter sp.]
MLSILAAVLMQAAAAVPAPPNADAPKPRYVTTVDWRRRPTGNDMSRVYPKGAIQRRIEGFATINCTVTSEGMLADCVVAAEGPAGEGFGEAALKLAPNFTMRPLAKDGVPVSGGTVRIPMKWVLPH